MLQSVQHPFIINLWGVFQDAGNLYMVMDFVPGGELFTLLRRSNVFRFPNKLINRLTTSLFLSASLTLLPSFTQLRLRWHLIICTVRISFTATSSQRTFFSTQMAISKLLISALRNLARRPRGRYAGRRTTLRQRYIVQSQLKALTLTQVLSDYPPATI